MKCGAWRSSAASHAETDPDVPSAAETLSLNLEPIMAESAASLPLEHAEVLSVMHECGAAAAVNMLQALNSSFIQT